MLRAAAMLAVLTACGTPCPNEPLSLLAGAPRFVVELTDVGSPSVASPADGGMDAPAPVLAEYAALALYDANGVLLHERWIDTYARWTGAGDTFDGRDGLPWTQPPGRLALLLAEPPSIAIFDLATSEVVTDLRAGSADGRLVDLAHASEGLALLSRSDGKLLTLDLNGDGAILRELDPSLLAGAPLRVGRLAPIVDRGVVTRIAVGLDGGDRAGAIGIVEVTSGALSLIELPGLRGCAEVAAFPPDPARPDVSAIAVLCAGRLDAEPLGRPEAGLVRLESIDGAPFVLSAGRPASTLFSGSPPTHALVTLSSGWVAALSRGDGTPDRPDTLFAAHLESDAGALLWQEPWTERYGPALGQGAFAPEIGVAGELVWPSSTSALLRFRLDGAGAGLRFVPRPALPAPDCFRLPARRVRHLPPL